MQELRSIAHALSGYASVVASMMTGPSAHLASHVNLPLMACLIQSIGFPNTSCVSQWFYGYVVVGDIADTGLFRPSLHDYEAEPAVVLTAASNRRWNSAVERSLTAQGESADPSTRRLLLDVEKSTYKELRAGTVKGPFSRAELDKKFGGGQYRVAERFGVYQGTDGAGDPKVRAIDNERSNSLNACTRTSETIAPMNVSFPALVARLLLGLLTLVGSPMLALSIGLDDMKAAYRQLPVCQPFYTVFAIWSVTRGRVEYYFLHGHNFGFRAAVLNFNAFAVLVVTCARVFLGVPCDQFFDDFMIIDLLVARTSGQDGLAGMLALLGQSHEPSKRKLMAPRNVGLGVQLDLSRAHTSLFVEASPLRHRIENVLGTLSSARAANWLLPEVAASVRGKLGFIFSASAFRFGSAALQPLLQREYFDAVFTFTPALQEALEFLLFVLPRMRSLRMQLRRDQRKPVLVWTDAMFCLVEGLPFLRIGFVIVCRERHVVLHSSFTLPAWFFTHVFSRNDKTFIAQGEALAPFAALLSAPEIFRGRSAIFFQDNAWALSSLIMGYASRPDMGLVVNAFHLAQFALDARVWFEWVPSDANVADLPSREEWEAFFRILPQSVWVPTVVPPLASWLLPFRSFAEEMLNVLGSA